ncbi:MULTISPECIES: hypothetical protein [Pseudanabaena]|uniref:EF-hand domain-containing protein n=2 Tax=Pseudanabaena TaxID=1152 RepID=L8N138_9CYAN|nr:MULTISPECIES: hypothetical protein [Pseudanabaena]ELS33436.1 hypothetical protein Pse7429DRAFT_1383 [Pseudanabaena biceps PCC 7429]MDG3494332.1 hypothetical protein [Pseudanabaena catenata USMAC16]
MPRKMQWIWRSLIAILVSSLMIATTIALQPTHAAIAPLPDPYLTSGKFVDGERVFSDYLQTNLKDDKARLGLGVIQFMRGTERLMQSLDRYGMMQTPLSGLVPFLRLPIPKNPQPQTLTYEGLQQVFQTWIDDLATVRNTLEPIKDGNFKLALRLGLIRLDFDGNGKATNDEMLWQIFNAITGANVTEKDAQQFLIAFDRGDALWLQGYTHVLGAIGEFLRAYDSRELFESCAHLFFQRVDTPHKFLITPRRESPDEYGYSFSPFEFLDLVSAVHLTKFPLADPQRMKTILNHLKSIVRLSRESWQSILAETDNDREWIPNPKQVSVIPQARVTDDMVKAWFQSLDEIESILTAKKNLPFWRDAKLSINFPRIFTEPRPFDLVSWVQGTAATPYLEKGTVTNMNVWNEMIRAFGSNLFNFTIWFN